MLDVLRGTDESRIQHVRLGLLGEQILRLLDQPFHADALLAAGALAQLLADSFQPLHLLLRLRLVLGEGALELRRSTSSSLGLGRQGL